MNDIFMIKKDPRLPASNDNWAYMGMGEYLAFCKTAEGKLRRYKVVRLGPCIDSDYTYYIECDDPQRWKDNKSADNHEGYIKRSEQEEGAIEVVSYHAFTFEDNEDLVCEDMLEDANCNVEDQVIQKVMVESVLEAAEHLSPVERDAIYSFFYTNHPITAKNWSEKMGIPIGNVSKVKKRAVKKLKKILNA